MIEIWSNYYQNFRKTQWDCQKEKNCKIHIKKSATLRNIYYFISIFERIPPGLKQLIFAVYERLAR